MDLFKKNLSVKKNLKIPRLPTGFAKTDILVNQRDCLSWNL